MYTPGWRENCSYIHFEHKMTDKVDRLWQDESDPQSKEMLRVEILRQRMFARDYWISIGKTIPPNITFLDTKMPMYK